MAVDTLRVVSSLGPPPNPKEEGEVAENLKILQMREAKLGPLFALLQQSLSEAQGQTDREAIDLLVSILEVTPIETIVVAERLVRFNNRKRTRVRPHTSCTAGI